MFVEPQVAPRPEERRALEREAVGVAWIVVPGGAAEPDHRVLFLRLELAAAEQFARTRSS